MVRGRGGIARVNYVIYALPRCYYKQRATPKANWSDITRYLLITAAAIVDVVERPTTTFVMLKHPIPKIHTILKGIKNKKTHGLYVEINKQIFLEGRKTILYQKNR